MIVIVLYAVLVLLVFWTAALTWSAISLQAKLNQAIEGILRIENALRLK